MNKWLLTVIMISASFFGAHEAVAQYGNPNDAIVQNPEILQTFVNRKIGMSAYRPSDLVPLDTLGASGMYIRQGVLSDLQKLMADMSSLGLPIKINSAFRSFDDQIQTYNEIVSANPKDINLVAVPGYSEHQLGTALDFSAVKTATIDPSRGFANTPQFAWLAHNGYKYGFALSYPAGGETVSGYTYEPWHWRYIGREAAAEWKGSGLPLATYLASKPQAYIAITLSNKSIKRAGDPTVYFVAPNGSKRGFISPQAFFSYGLQWADVLTVVDEQVAGFSETKAIKIEGDPTVYQLDGTKNKHAISSEAVFFRLGLQWSDIVTVNPIEAEAYKTDVVLN